MERSKKQSRKHGITENNFSFRVFRTSVIFLLITSYVDAASRQPVHAKQGMVASVSEIASRVGVETMQKGGNAVDAAVATALTLSVVWPIAGNLGGGGFMLIRMADGTTVAIDYRERAPIAAHRDMYLDANGNVIKDASTIGYKAIAVPGTVAGLSLALKRFGKLKWEEVVEPARKLAADGVALNYFATKEICNYKKSLVLFPETKKILFPNERCLKEGERLIQTDLAKTLLRLKQNGPEEFYQGQTARLIVDAIQQNGGYVTMEDLKLYQPSVRKPVRGIYRDYEILTMPPPSSGGIILIEMLQMLEHFDVSKFGFHSSDQIHLFVEVMRRAYADRAELLGDPDFVGIPTEKLLSRQYAASLVKTISMEKATASKMIFAGTAGVESNDTTHFTIVDPQGNIVCNTYTLNDSFGSRVIAAGTGILLNNEMDDFTSKPGVPNFYGLIQGENNAIAPRKRPLSSMTPTIVLKKGKPYIALGSKGGPTIINQVLQVLVNVIDFGMTLQEAVDAPRFHHQWLPDEIFVEPFALNKDARDSLERRGNRIAQKSFFSDTPFFGDVEAVLIVPETDERQGVSDPRLGGASVGY